MPKETIATRTEDDVDTMGKVLEHRVERIAVAWGRGQDGPEAVQVTIAQESYVVRDGMDLFDAPGTSHELYSAGLSRREINRLIEVLRKARNQVFGTDV
jgi:hypothetical protein